LTPLTIAAAPEASRRILESIQKPFSFIPNLMDIFTNSPTVLQGYLALDARANSAIQAAVGKWDGNERTVQSGPAAPFIRSTVFSPEKSNLA
jgi:hypothetical protein